MKRVYVRQNDSRPRPYKFRLRQARAQSMLSTAAADVARDWDGVLLKSYPGYQAYSQTLGDYHSKVMGDG